MNAKKPQTFSSVSGSKFFRSQIPEESLLLHAPEISNKFASTERSRMPRNPKLLFQFNL